MRRQRTSLFALALSLLAAAVPTAGAAQTQLTGTWAINRQASDNIQTAINTAVARMNFVTRPIARGRLTRTNQAYNRLAIRYSTENVSIQYEQRAPIVTPSNGTPTRWRREDGEMFDVSTEWENGRLEQTFAAEDGRRVNVYSLSADGNTLTMDVTLTSPRLAQPVRYKLVYNRVP